MQADGYRGLREAAAWLDLSGRGKILARGEDRARLLHAMATNHVEGLKPGQGCYAFFLNAQGRILGDVNIFSAPGHFLLDTEPETGPRLYAHLDRHIIADDVSLEDVTSGVATLAVEGPKAAEVLASLGAPVPGVSHAHAPWGSSTIARVDSTGAGGCFVFVPAEDKDGLVRRISAAGAVLADPDAARAVRLENGRPRYGEDFTEEHIPHETQLLHAVHFNKGCYIGQEIVERVRSRGHVNRLLVRLEIDSNEPPAAGAAVIADGKQAGSVTTSAWSPALSKVLAFAWVRAEYSCAGNAVTADGIPARVLPLRPPQM